MRSERLSLALLIGALAAPGCSEPPAGGDVGAGVDAGAASGDAAPPEATLPDAASPDTRSPYAGPHTPNPKLADLPDNTVIDLGPYACKDRAPDIGCTTIFDFSRLNYDPYNHRVLLFGGGHAASGRTDVDVLDLGTLEWSSLYPTMTCDAVKANDVDPRGFHRATGHPVARHTYDQNVIAEVNGTGRFLMLSSEGNAGSCHSYVAPIQAIARLDLSAGNTTWEYGEDNSISWHYAGAAEFDPVSGMVINLGAGRGAGYGGMYVIDPGTMKRVVYEGSIRPAGLHNSLVYEPTSTAMYHFVRGEKTAATKVRRLSLERADFTKSTVVDVEAAGSPPIDTAAFAFDTYNRVFGGGVQDGRFFTFDPATNAWRSEEMVVAPADGVVPGRVTFLHLDYDPVNNVFIFIAKDAAGGAYRTWAYRYRR